MKQKLLLLLAAMGLVIGAQAQQKIKDGTVTGSSPLPNPAAVLELESNNKGVLFPRVSLTSTTTWLPTGIALQHNNSTDGTAYSDADAFISQYQGGNLWSSAATSDFVSAGLHSHSGLTLSAAPADAGTWFKKASDPVTPLPVQLLVFSAAANGCSVALHWETGVENNFSHFELMRSTDGINYNMIGRVDARGDNSSYDYTDTDPVQGRNAYRLRIVDRDGSVTYSDVETVFIDCSASIVIYPNPTHGNVTIEGLKGDERIRVIDALGRVMKEATATSTIMHLDLSSLADAAYNIMLIRGNSIQQTFKVIKKD